ncbi:MAG: heavy metal translocating P-type ATPase [Chlamydiales bacterium]|nr:heavy metal translocating P-type ATPase [Chlamydiales bacterium]
MANSTHISSSSSTSTEVTCALCGVHVDDHPILEEGRAFCCPGCHAVFNILRARNELSHYQRSPVFQQALKAGLISNVALLQELRRRSLELEGDLDRQKIHLEITDMWCPSCAEVIQWIVLDINGIIRCAVDYSTDIAVIEFSPKKTSKEAILKTINGLGYHAVPLEDSVERKVSSSLYVRFVVAVFCALNIMMFSYPIYASYYSNDTSGYAPLFVWLSFALSIPVLTYCSWPLMRRAWTGVRAGVYGMETLVTLGVLASFGYSTYEMLKGSLHVYFDAMSVIVSFVLLGKIIESRAKFSAKESLLRLARYLPRRARRIGDDGTEIFVPIKDIKPGHMVVALMGEKIALEGVVVEGHAIVDESVMTGESLPVPKETGSDVLSGTVVKQGRIVYRVTTTHDKSLLQQVVGMVEHDLKNKDGYVRAADVVARWFVPVIVVVAVLTAAGVLWLGVSDPGQSVIETAVLRSVAVLLISCPCAIGIAAPLAESLLMTTLASMGAIVRNRGCLRFLGAETAVVFDKTGTITEGLFQVRCGLAMLSSEHLQIIKGLTSRSIHPLSLAISQAIEESPAQLDRVEEQAGRGLRGVYEGRYYYLGSEALLNQYGIAPSDQAEVGNLVGICSHVFFAEEKTCLSRIVLGDRLRQGAVAAVESCIPASTHLISGDAAAAVSDVAQRCGFTDWKAGFSPLEKREYVEELRRIGETVTVLGDGVNDAPALSGANVGISVVSATDVSIQVSDILLTTDNLAILGTLREQACRARRIIAQNLAWAFSYNVIGIPLAILGTLTPVYSAVAMVASSLIVLFNALRLRSVPKPVNEDL